MGHTLETFSIGRLKENKPTKILKELHTIFRCVDESLSKSYHPELVPKENVILIVVYVKSF